MSDNKPVTPPVAAKLSELSTTDRKIAEIEEKLNKPLASDKDDNKTGTSPSICGEPQSIDDYVSAMLGLDKKK